MIVIYSRNLKKNEKFPKTYQEAEKHKKAKKLKKQ